MRPGETCERCGLVPSDMHVDFDTAMKLHLSSCRPQQEELRGEGLLAFWTDPKPEEHASLLYCHDNDAFSFVLKNKEVLRIQRDGSVLVQGRTCGNDTEIFEAVQRFFKTTFGAADG